MSGSATVPGKLVNSVFNKVLGPDVLAGVRETLKAEGLDLVALPERVGKPLWFRAIELTAASLYPTVGAAAEQQRQLGRHVIAALQSRKLLKGPWVTMAKFLGPRRAMKQAADFGSENSPVKLSVREAGAKELEITVDEGQQTEFLAGVLEALVGMLGGKEARVATVSSSETQTVFSATWR